MLTQATREAVITAMQRISTGTDARSLGTACGIDLDDWQARFVDSPSRRLLLNASRQSGKTTATALKGLRIGLQHPGTTTAIFAAGERQAKIVLQAAKQFIKTARDGLFPKVAADSTTHIIFADDTQLLSMPATEATVRGVQGVRTLIIDEASRVPEALYIAIRPTIASVQEAVIIALSTPNGRRGWWSEAWHEGGDLWERWEVPATECPRITAEFLEEEKRELGERAWRQEYFGSFEAAEDAVFTEADIARQIAEDIDDWAYPGLGVAGETEPPVGPDTPKPFGEPPPDAAPADEWDVAGVAAR